MRRLLTNRFEGTLGLLEVTPHKGDLESRNGAFNPYKLGRLLRLGLLLLLHLFGVFLAVKKNLAACKSSSFCSAHPPS